MVPDYLACKAWARIQDSHQPLKSEKEEEKGENQYHKFCGSILPKSISDP
jgi:hypothetical protein